MELVTSLRTLWRFRLSLAVVGLMAVVVGIGTAYRIEPPATLSSRQYHVALGSAQVLVDTPSSQIADLGGSETTLADIATLSARASLLANLMANSPMKEQIAQRAGVTPKDLIAVPPPSAVPGAGAESAAPGSTARLSDPKANILKVSIPELPSGQIPIIDVHTQAPDERTARRLADQAIAVLESNLASVADGDAVPSQRRVIVSPLGRAQASVESRGPAKKTAIVAAALVFALGCGAILGLVALVGGWRRAGDLERSLDGEPPSDEHEALVYRRRAEAAGAWEPEPLDSTDGWDFGDAPGERDQPVGKRST